MECIWGEEIKERGWFICILQSKCKSVQTTERDAMAQNKTPYHGNCISLLTKWKLQGCCKIALKRLKYTVSTYLNLSEIFIIEHEFLSMRCSL